MFGQLRSRGKLNRLIRHWMSFRDLVLLEAGSEAGSGSGDSLDRKGPVALKARIAGLMPVLSEASPTALAAESDAHARGMARLLSQYPAGPSGEAAPDDIRHVFEQQWQEHYIFLNRLKGTSAGSRRPLAANGLFVPTGIPALRRARRRRLGRLWGLGQLLLWGAFVYVGILLLEALARWSRSRAGATAGSTDGLGGGLVDAIRSTAAGIARFFHPVTQAYGSETTTILVVILALGMGYLLFRPR